MNLRIQFVLCAALAGCAGTPQSVSPTNWKNEPAAPNAEAPPSVLYARDGTAVPASGAAPTREIGGGDGSRVFLLDLYQRAMDEKDALTLQVQGLDAQLAQENKKFADAAQQMIAMQVTIDTLTKERDALKSDTLDLAQRLTTAQIRRLEAEKSLLELQIEVQRREEAAQTVRGAAMLKKSGGDK